MGRERLARRLDLALERRVAVLHAPAGYGKSSLLAHWHQSLIARGVPTAWLSLDENDRDLFQFLGYVMEAFRSCGLVFGAQVFPPPSGVPGTPSGAMVGAVVTELAKCAATVVLILDDFHRAESPENCQAVNRFISVLPANIHIAISTREYPSALSLADLRTREDLLEIDHSALQFSELEIASWLGG